MAQLGRERQRISVQLLEQSAAHAKGTALRRESSLQHGLQDPLQTLIPDAVALDHATPAKHLETLLVHIDAKDLFGISKEKVGNTKIRSI